MQQIADAAGVSRMTVSLALRNHPRISAETRERIQQVAQRLGYRPDPEVSKLMAYLRRTKSAKQSTVLGLVTDAEKAEPWRLNRHYNKFYQGACHRAAQFGYQLEEFWLKEPGMTSRRLTKILETRSVEGLVIGPISRSLGHLSIDFSRFAAAKYGQDVWRPLLHRADHNQFQGMLLAMRQLQRLGYRKIGLAILEGYDRRVMHSWEGAFLFSQQRIPPAGRVPAFVTRSLDHDGFVKWFRRLRPDSVVSSHPHVRGWLKDCGVRVPDDVGFFFLDRLDATDGCAGIDQHYDLVAAAVVDLVVAQLHRNERGVPAIAQLVLIDGDWVDGPTVRKQK